MGPAFSLLLPMWEQLMALCLIMRGGLHWLVLMYVARLLAFWWMPVAFRWSLPREKLVFNGAGKQEPTERLLRRYGRFLPFTAFHSRDLYFSSEEFAWIIWCGSWIWSSLNVFWSCIGHILWINSTWFQVIWEAIYSTCRVFQWRT